MTQLILSFRSQKNAAVEPDWFPKPGYTYCVTRAISARINQNYDAWPSSELKKMVPTWIGKPCFVNHNNDDIERSRGKIIAARYIESSDDKYIETVMEVDAKTFPRLAKEIREGGLDSVSIGIEAGLTICSYCGNKATDEPEFCDHVRYHKGEKLPKTNQKTGKTENVLVYESCYKLTGFELSFVFDPADETAVVSRVIAANKKESYDNWDSYDPDHEPKKPGKIRQKIKEFFDPDEILDELRRERKLRDFRDDYKTHKELVHVGSRRHGYGETQAPEDIDTLRDEDGETAEDYQFVEPVEDNDASEDIPFEHWIESPEELLTPDLGQTKRLDREQEDEGLDTDRRVEDVEDIMSDDEADMAQPPLQGRQAMARTGKDNRVDPDDLKDYSRGVPEIFRDMDEDSGDFFDYVDSIRPKKARRRQAAEVPDELLEHITEDLEELEQFTGEGYEDEYEEMPEEGDDYEAMEAMEEALGADLDGDGEEGEDAQHAEAVLGGEPQLMQASRRRPVGTMSSARKSRSTRRKGSSMAGSLSERYRVARRSEQSEDGYGHSYDTTRVRGRETNGRGEPVNEYGERTGEPALESDYQGRHRAARRRRRADTSGHVDGGPYGNDSDQGNLEEVYISQVPAAEAVAAPADDESNISNTEQTLVAHRLQREIKARAADLQRYLTAYRRVAGDNIETPSEVNPALSGTDQQDLKGDFESVQPEDVHTQPKDASVRVFRAFDNWLRSTTGRTAAQHGNANFIRRQAASYSKAAGIPLEKMFPALDVVLRQTRKAERSAPMNRRRAEFDGATVAPDARIDVEAPVKNVTDADAQASQYDLGDYGNNAGDDIANPNTETDSQIWAPKEGNRKADAVAAVRYAEAYINAGLPCEDKWKLVAQAQTIRHATVVDRTRLLEYVAQTNAARSKKVTAAVSRGTTNGIPKGLTAPRPAQRTAANDSADDFGLWF